MFFIWLKVIGKEEVPNQQLELVMNFQLSYINHVFFIIVSKLCWIFTNQNGFCAYCISLVLHLQAIDLDPTDATLLSNRSLCWIRLGQAEHALVDAKACRTLRSDWPKACYREGAALRLLQVCYGFSFFQMLILKIKGFSLYYDIIDCPRDCRSLKKQPMPSMRE